MKKYNKPLRLQKISIIGLMILSLSIQADEPDVLENQSNKKTTSLYMPFSKVEKSQFHYVFGPDGDRVVSVNFNSNGTLISKTTYDSKEEQHRFIYTDSCKKNECQQFMHH
tara:strand:- start:3100 stop:3432 length:333 start_codon:yes stop_codon:yes gene_type:complete